MEPWGIWSSVGFAFVSIVIAVCRAIHAWRSSTAKKHDGDKRADAIYRVVADTLVAALLLYVLILATASYDHWVGWVCDHIFLCIAQLPALIAIIHHVSSAERRFATVVTSVGGYKEFRSAYDVARRGHDFHPQNELYGDDLAEYSPVFAHTVLGALSLSAIFTAAAILSSADYGFGTTATAPDPIKGFVYAAYGAWAYALYLVLHRITTTAMSGRFLVTTALRSAMGAMFGFAAGSFGVQTLKSDYAQLFIYFVIGMFPLWALQAIRTRARKALEVPEEGCDIVPLCLVDGLDDGLIERLEELGIWDVQHLATADPGEIALKTLFPLNRVTEWVDQSILINHVRNAIVHFRKLNIKGAVDLAEVYGHWSGLVPDPTGTADTERAGSILHSLAKLGAIDFDALVDLAARLYTDYTVVFLWNLWQRPGALFKDWVETIAKIGYVIFSAVREANEALRQQDKPQFKPATPPSWMGGATGLAKASREFHEAFRVALANAGVELTDSAFSALLAARTWPDAVRVMWEQP